jgi:hypothetical protein
MSIYCHFQTLSLQDVVCFYAFDLPDAEYLGLISDNLVFFVMDYGKIPCFPGQANGPASFETGFAPLNQEVTL